MKLMKNLGRLRLLKVLKYRKFEEECLHDDQQVKYELVKYEPCYSDSGLIKKLTKYGKKIGLNSTYYVLLLYQVLKSGEVSLADKAIIVGVLGYFISPLDLIPDWLTGMGFLDESSLILFVLKKIADSITPAIDLEARRQLHNWFSFSDSELECSFAKKCSDKV